MNSTILLLLVVFGIRIKGGRNSSKIKYYNNNNNNRSLE